MGALSEVFALFSFNVDPKGAKTANDTVDGVKERAQGASEGFKELAKTAAAFLGFSAIKTLVTDQIELGSKVNDTAERLGVGVDELQAFQYAAKLSGVEAESAANGLKFLNKNVGEALGGNAELAKSFADLKVPLKDSQGNVRKLGDLVPELAEGFSKMGSQQERVAAATKIFGKAGDQLIPILSQGKDGVAGLYAEFETLGGGLSKDFVEAADKAGDEIDKLKVVTGSLKSQIVLAVLPGITSLVQAMKGASVKTLGFAKDTNALKVGWGALAIGGFGVGINRLGALSKAFGFVAKEGSGLAGTLKQIGAFGLKAFAWVAVIALVALAVEDLYTLFTGGKSAIGEWVDEIFGVGTAAQAVHEVRDAFNDASAALEPYKADIAYLVDHAFPILKDVALIAAGALTAGFEQASSTVDTLIEKFERLIASAFHAAEAASRAASGVARSFGATETADDSDRKAAIYGRAGALADKDANEKAQQAQQAQSRAIEAVQFTQGNQDHLSAIMAGMGRVNAQPVGTNSVLAPNQPFRMVQPNQTNTINIKIEGSGDAKKTGEVVSEAVKTGMDQHLKNAAAAVPG